MKCSVRVGNFIAHFRVLEPQKIKVWSGKEKRLAEILGYLRSKKKSAESLIALIIRAKEITTAKTVGQLPARQNLSKF